jgi:hypothetical protein
LFGGQVEGRVRGQLLVDRLCRKTVPRGLYDRFFTAKYASVGLFRHASASLVSRGRSGILARPTFTFPGNLADPPVRAAAFEALHRVPKKSRRRSLVIEKIDGRPVRESTLWAEMMQCGFVSDYRGLASEGFV